MSDPETPKPAPEPAPAPTTPAVHGDTLWDGPRVFDQHDGTPELIETKSQYWDYVNRHGLRMKHQQESTTGPVRPSVETPVVKPIPVVPALTQAEAHIFGAITAILKRYGLIETIWCDACAARGDHAGCRMLVSDKRVVLACRCGMAKYEAPTGATDLVLSKMANTAVTENDQTMGSVMTPTGPRFQPTTLLHDTEAKLLRRYVQTLRARQKEPRWFHPACWDGNPLNEDQSVGMKVTSREIVLVCACRTLFHATITSIN
jgi:hypothetical protein